MLDRSGPVCAAVAVALERPGPVRLAAQTVEPADRQDQAQPLAPNVRHPLHILIPFDTGHPRCFNANTTKQ